MPNNRAGAGAAGEPLDHTGIEKLAPKAAPVSAAAVPMSSRRKA
jgi:hypothetical protein